MTTTLMQRCRAASLAVAVIVSGTATGVRADENAAPPSDSKPAETRTTTQMVSTEAGGTVPAAPAPPTVTPAPLPALPNAAPPADPTPPTDGAASSEPAAPSEYDQAADTDPAALDDFREPLSPYGTWEDDGTYGVVWVPSSVVVGADFAPYVSHGHWGLAADSSWLWVSDFSWGWAPFHYGRWVWIGGRGWAWIPGRVYSPAWVVWRTGFYDDYYVGWAPMPPTWYWRSRWAHRLGFWPPAPYVFCSATYVFSPHVRTYIAPPARVSLIAPRTRPYVAATPGVASTGHSAITMTRGPSLADAHVPLGSAPAQRTAPDARAVSFAQMHPPSRSFATAQPGAFSRPLSPAGASMAGPRSYTPYTTRPLPPTGASMQPPMPAMPHPAPVAPSMPRSYSPPGAPFARPAPAPVMRPASPAPVYRPTSPPPANVTRPSVVAPRSVAPPAVRPAPAVPRNFSR